VNYVELHTGGIFFLWLKTRPGNNGIIKPFDVSSTGKIHRLSEKETKAIEIGNASKTMTGCMQAYSIHDLI